MQEDLKKLGLTDNEIKVYLSLLKIGKTPVGAILHDLKIHRQIAYNALEALETKNMVQKTIKNKVNHYQVSDPGNIVENIKKQELIAKRIQKSIKDEMKKSRHEQEINVFSGQEQLRSFYSNLYKKMPNNIELLGLHTFGKEYISVMGLDFLKKMEKIRQKKKMSTRHIASESRRHDMREAINALDNKTRKVRFINYSYLNPISTMLCDDIVWFQSFHSIEPFIIAIKNKQFYLTFSNHFEELWKIAKP